MKFRSILCVAAFAATSLFADDLPTTDTVGWLKVDSTAVSTIVSVPWIQVGTTAGSVQVAKLVKTDSLKADGGVMLYYYDGTAYKAWALQTVENVKTWVPASTTISSNGKSITATAPTADFPLPRGKALFVYRPNGEADGYIYLYGKYTETSPASFTTATGSADAPAYTLIGNPSAEAVSLNKSGLFTNVGGNDKIMIPGASGALEKECTYENDEWGWWNPALSTLKVGSKTIKKPGRDTNVSIPAGRGVWYVSRGGTATVQF